MPLTNRQYQKYTGAIVSNPTPSVTPSYTPWPQPSFGPVTPSPTATPSTTPPITPSISITPSSTPASYYIYKANEYECSVNGVCMGYLGEKTVTNSGSLIIGQFYTASVSRVYQIVVGSTTNTLPPGVINVDNKPYNSCGLACAPASCVSGSIVYYSSVGWISYQTCDGSTNYLYLECGDSCSIDVCHRCDTITGSAGPGGSGSIGIITDIICGKDCFIPVSPSVSPTPTISITPTISVTPSVTKTPSVSITPSITPTISVTPSVTLTPFVSPSCTCPTGYTGSYDGTTCYSSSVVSAITSSTSNSINWTSPNQAYGDFGVRIYSGSTFNLQGDKTFGDYAFEGQTLRYSGTPTSPLTNFWQRRQNRNGIWDINEYWPSPNYPGTLGMCATLQIPTTKIYYIGLAGDNGVTIKINGTTVINQDAQGQNSTRFKWWHIYPFVLNAGPNLIELQNTNASLYGSYAAEIYDNTLAELTSSTITPTNTGSLRIIWSTGDYLPERVIVWPDSFPNPQSEIIPQGSKYGQSAFCTNYTCPEGYTLDTTVNPVVCRKIDYISSACNPSPSPTISVTPSVTPSISVTPSVTPSVTGTPCISNTPTPTISISLTPTPSLGCNCVQGYVTNPYIFSYYNCSGSRVFGWDQQSASICLDTSRDYTRNIYLQGTSPSCSCGTFCSGNVVTNSFFNEDLSGWTTSGSVWWSLSQAVMIVLSPSATSSISQNALTEGTTYNISFKHKTNATNQSPNCSGSVYILAGSASYGPITPPIGNLYTGYASVSVNLTCVSSSTFSVQYRGTYTPSSCSYGSNEYYLDDICITEI